MPTTLPTILFAGAEPDHFVLINGTPTTANGANSIVLETYQTTRWRAATARCAINPTSDYNNPGNPPSNSTVTSRWCYLRCPFVSASSSFSTSARVWLSSDNSNPRTGILWSAMDASGVMRLAVAGVNNPSGNVVGQSGPWGFYSVNAAGTWTQLTAAGGATGFSGGPSEPDKVDFVVDYSTTGSVAMYINGQPHASFSGDVTTDGATALAYVQLGPWSPNLLETAWSEVLVLEGNTLDASVIFRPPTGNGTTQQLTGDYTTVSQIVASSMSIAATTAAGQVELYTSGQQVPAGLSVLGVVDCFLGTAGTLADGPPNLEPARSIGGTLYTAPPIALPRTLGRMFYVWQENPATGQPWQPADLNSGSYEQGCESSD